jgi:hypothetical protein
MWYWRTVVEITDGDFEEVGGSVGWAARLGDTLKLITTASERILLACNVDKSCDQSVEVEQLRVHLSVLRP